MSKLLTEELLSDLPDLYTHEDATDPTCHIKLFTPDSNWTWYIIELSKSDGDTCFGYVEGLEDELGYFTLSELENIKGQLGLSIELDTSFTPALLSQVKGGRS